LKASLAKFNDKCYLEAQKLKMVYILCYKEKPEYPTFAQRLSDAATGENGQPYLLHSTSETDLVGKLKSKLLTRLTTDLQHIKEGFKARDHWTTNLIAGPMCSQEFIDEIQVADPSQTPRGAFQTLDQRNIWKSLIWVILFVIKSSYLISTIL